MRKSMKSFWGVFLASTLVIGAINLGNVSNANAQTAETYKCDLYSQGAVVPIEEFFVPSANNKTTIFSFSQGSLEQSIYDCLNNLSTELNVSKYNISSADFKTALENVINSCPELFYVDQSYQIVPNSRGNIETFMPIYKDNAATINTKKTYFQQEMNNILFQVDKSWSDLEKIVFIHDYLAQHFEYDTSYQIYDAYNFFKNGKGVCQAYTGVFAGLMKELGIDVSTAASTSMNHIWNTVELNGSWYHIDVTWDDPTSDILGQASHNNLLLSDTAIATARGTSPTYHSKWTTSNKCSSTKYDNYFWYTKEISSPFKYIDNNWYYTYFNSSDTSASLFKTSSLSSEGSDVKKLGLWTMPTDTSSYYPRAYAGLEVYNDELYFNTPSEILAYNPASNSYKTILSESSSVRIAGLRVDGQTLKYITTTNYKNYSKKTKTLETPTKTVPPITTAPTINNTTPPKNTSTGSTTSPVNPTDNGNNTSPANPTDNGNNTNPENTVKPGITFIPINTINPNIPISGSNIGDVNLDGKVNLNDAKELLKAALGITTLTPEKAAVADLDFDGKVNLNDAKLALKLSLGIIKITDLQKK